MQAGVVMHAPECSRAGPNQGRLWSGPDAGSDLARQAAPEEQMAGKAGAGEQMAGKAGPEDLDQKIWSRRAGAMQLT